MAPQHSRKEKRGTGLGLLAAALVFVTIAAGVLALAMTGRLRPLVEKAFPSLAAEEPQPVAQQVEEQEEDAAPALAPKDFSDGRGRH